MDLDELKTLNNTLDVKIEKNIRYNYVKVIIFISILLAFTVIVTKII